MMQRSRNAPLSHFRDSSPFTGGARVVREAKKKRAGLSSDALISGPGLRDQNSSQLSSSAWGSSLRAVAARL